MQSLVRIFFLWMVSINMLSAQYKYGFQNPNLPVDDRVKNLISQLTLDEKINQLMSDAPAIERLGIPKYDWWNEALHGVARAGYATVFPQSITMAGTWNTELMHEVATVISDEVRAKHHEYKRKGQHDIYQGLTIWSPNINIFRDPRWGRGHETYGEDPYLTAQMGLQFVKGLQGEGNQYLKTVATAKHFAVHSGPESLRHEFNVNVSQRDLWETYLPAFRTLVEEGKVHSIMTAYNRVRGEAASSSPLLFDILRNKWKFEGYVVSDCGAIDDIYKDHKIKKTAAEASAFALKEGCDLNCGSTYKELKTAVSEGLIQEDKIDLALSRLFLARFKLGMFDEDRIVPFAQIPFIVNDNVAHKQLARKASQESIILLKNDKNILPLSKNIRKIAVIGPNANNVQSLLGNYNGNPSNPITVLSGIQNKVEPKVEVVHTEGALLADGLPTMEVIPSVYLQTADGKQGLTAEYFNNLDWSGTPLYTQTDDQVNFNWDTATPNPKLEMGNYSVRWSGYIIAPETGEFYFSNWAKPFQEFTIDEVKDGGKYKHHAKINPEKISLQKEKKYRIEVKYKNYYGDATAKMLWSVPKSNQLEEALTLANSSDVVVLALGLNDRLEGEEMGIKLSGFDRGDRTSLDLPESQLKLMKAIVETGKPVVLVLLNGSALSINYASKNIPAIIAAGYPGQEGGNAIADVLFGDYNPAGRLPVTYYKSVTQLPDFENYDMNGRTYRYFKEKPLYPFGHGLSYTQFAYSDLKLPVNLKTGDAVNVSVKVRNSGKVDGDEVVQLYITDEKASTPRPIRQLVGFKRVFLKKGEEKEVQFVISKRQFSLIDNKDMLVIEPGWFTISAGGKQPDFDGTLNPKETQTITKRFELKGKTQILDF